MRTDGLKIRRLRMEKGYGLTRFAAAVGLSGAGLSRVENGQRNPRPETLMKIAIGLGCRISDIAEHDPTSGDSAGEATPTLSAEHVVTTAM